MRMTLLALAGLMLTSGAMAAKPPADKPDVKLPPLPAAAAVIATPPLTPDNTLLLDLSTGGRVTIQMRPDMAPRHVDRIKTLVRQGFYNGTIFHRVIDGFMAQGGDPTGTGTGGSKLPDIKAEFNALPHVRGAVAMARAGSVDSANSQFYIVLQPTLKLDGAYTVWGRVTDGMDYVDAIEKGEPPEHPSKIVKASLAADSGAAAMTPVPAGSPTGVVAGAGASGAVIAPATATMAVAPTPPATTVAPPATTRAPVSAAAADAARTSSVVGMVPVPPSASPPAAPVVPADVTPAAATPPQ